MFYETKLINGVLHYRSTPDGEWAPCSNPSPHAVAMAALDLCSSEERKDIFAGYCTCCGNVDDACKCLEGE